MSKTRKIAINSNARFPFFLGGAGTTPQLAYIVQPRCPSLTSALTEFKAKYKHYLLLWGNCSIFAYHFSIKINISILLTFINDLSFIIKVIHSFMPQSNCWIDGTHTPFIPFHTFSITIFCFGKCVIIYSIYSIVGGL